MIEALFFTLGVIVTLCVLVFIKSLAYREHSYVGITKSDLPTTYDSYGAFVQQLSCQSMFLRQQRVYYPGLLSEWLTRQRFSHVVRYIITENDNGIRLLNELVLPYYDDEWRQRVIKAIGEQWQDMPKTTLRTFYNMHTNHKLTMFKGTDIPQIQARLREGRREPYEKPKKC